MEYANTFSLDFPVELWRPFAQDRPSVRCSSGYLIYLQGTEATCFYYLKKGKVKSFIQSEDGAERTLNLYQQGSIFGEASFFDELPRVSSAVALTPCEIVPIDREQVTAEFTRNPGMAMAMLKYLARTVRLLSAHVDDMAFRPAEWRVAQYLLSAASGQDQVSCTQEEIASSISVSRVTVSRILNQFSRRGLVALGYRSISLLDRRTLETLCTP
ncbi:MULTISPECIES: Crp/Fnr family transcriptional regulator [Clostridium]|jgi:CRP/FNR family transcriptional regulator|uniref:Crp/Fnr family transcriptional regulator n=1 Tax=Clostridium TaxID=1485 RepID=UPI00067E6C32|nr:MULTISPECIES: Crp/Fnr family transcriptional regulator [Clostridium]MBP8858473.1 Crp/Fnr family transcriptional regulator [Lawsonibacter sp.]MBS5505449.1 Crp/Fnr family transcriptional regulator [Oscillospiraceae bacterium]MCB5924365.1 Crp/Fnr family transcriptional regulator [bacterium 210820-DFI.5.26]GBF70480.1 hypothetical protein LAWASA_3214 [Lawsonibacter asaccharolyticus]MCQ5157692.1 Crp/Fnr family transcriptional regulator [Clostridium sp. DFI.5.61]